MNDLRKVHLTLPKAFANMRLNNSYGQLPNYFYSAANPTPVNNPSLISVNEELANELGLDFEVLASADGVALLAGNAIIEGTQPIAEVYAGHQFGHFNPQLGDGRAILLGDLIDREGRHREIQLKGAGPTPYSRNGDGRAALGPVIREYVLSEAMHRLGIKTTRALAAVATGEVVYRQTALPGAVITRVAASHVRIGTFEYFARRGNTAAVKQLADFVIGRHYPEIASATNPYVALLSKVITAQANLVADWLLVGFTHGVMNTDNMTVSGETIDYGPCAFLETYDPATVFSSIDHDGRYAYGNQGSIALWNLTRLAECLLPLLHENQGTAVGMAEEELTRFSIQFNDRWHQGMGRKLGLTQVSEADHTLIADFLHLLQNQHADFTLGFRLLSKTLSEGINEPWLTSLGNTIEAHAWLQQWHRRLQQESPNKTSIARLMDAVNPLYIPRNHIVEQSITAAYHGDFNPMEDLMRVLSEPFTEQPQRAKYATPAPTSDEPYQTFCGT